MAIAKLNGGRGTWDLVKWPQAAWISSAYTLQILSAAAHRVAATIQIPKTGNLSKVHFQTGNVTTGDTLHISFQNVSSVGLPDGTEDQYRTLVIDSADDNVWKTSGILTDTGADGGAKRAVTAGDRIAIVFKWNSYVAGNMWFQYLADTTSGQLTALLTSTNSGSTWTVGSGALAIALEYDDGTFAYLDNTFPVSAFTTNNVGNGSTPDEYGLKFRVPFKTSIRGIAFRGASQDVEFLLYPESGAALASAVTPYPSSTSPTNRREAYFATDVELDANTWYRIAWRPSTGTTRQLVTYTLNAAGMMEAFSIGLNAMLCTRTDGGSWTDTDTQFVLATPLCNGVDDGAGGGGGGCSLANGTAVIPPTCL